MTFIFLLSVFHLFFKEQRRTKKKYNSGGRKLRAEKEK